MRNELEDLPLACLLSVAFGNKGKDAKSFSFQVSVLKGLVIIGDVGYLKFVSASSICSDTASELLHS